MHHDRLAGICCTCCARSETVIRVRVGFATTSSSSWLSWLFQGWHIHISTSTVFAYPGGNTSHIESISSKPEVPLNSYAYEPSKLSLCLLPRVQGSLCPAAGLPLSSDLLHVRAVAGSLGAQLFTTTCSLYESSLPTAGTRRFLANASTSDDSCLLPRQTPAWHLHVPAEITNVDVRARPFRTKIA